jgi:hypothetical protein
MDDCEPYTKYIQIYKHRIVKTEFGKYNMTPEYQSFLLVCANVEYFMYLCIDYFPINK